ncbi:glucose and ribitol dehydrogenase1-like [Dorcoceras hygrometricum]|uniref:Glucose and ribitol dehydrogenase1-like n=1 Tax=Dorcoceras hygrometricum TaxID=472368 RepID=A0A2Z7CJK1_9LAMI|nr:glucose and ribitol dehydrogenase1-like [Dorcoceras hygrometricum]
MALFFIQNALQVNFDSLLSIPSGGMRKAMVIPSTKKASVFAVQLSLLMEGVPGLKLCESKALPSLKILSVKSIGTNVAKKKPAEVELIEEKKLLLMQRKQQQSRPHGWRAVVVPTIQIHMARPPKRKLYLVEDSDSEDTKPLKKSTPVPVPIALAVPKPTPKEAESTQIPNEESFSLEEILLTIRAKAFPPSVASTKPLTQIRWIQGIRIRLETRFFFAKVSRLRQFTRFDQSSLTSTVSTLRANVAKLLQWAETDSLKVAFKRRLLVQAKLRELLLRKLLIERNKNFVPGTSFTSIEIMVIDVLGEVHKIALLAYLGLRRQHNLVWTLPRPSNLFSGSNQDTAECSIFSSLQPMVNKCTHLEVISSA